MNTATSPKEYTALGPYGVEDQTTADLKAALEKRGAKVWQEGGANKTDIVADAGAFAIIFELTQRKGSAGAAEYPQVRAHRDEVEAKLNKPTYALFSGRGRTHIRMITDMWSE